MSIANHNSYCNFRQLHVTLTPKPRTLIVSANYTTLRDNHTQIMSSSLSLYEVLGVSASASCHEIKSAYRRLARACHPDVVAVKHKEASAGEFMKIQTAYSTLSDPSKRADYDRGLCLGRWCCDNSSFSSSSSASGFSGYGGKNWETDQCW